MSAELQPLVDQLVSVVTNDGRLFVGTLKGFDQMLNVILNETQERVFSSTAGVEEVQLGLYIVRGDNIAIIGEIDRDLDAHLDLASVIAEPLPPIIH